METNCFRFVSAYDCLQLRRVSPIGDGYQYYYGYYDNPAFSKNDRFHLCSRVHFMDRRPVPGDICELGYIDLETGDFQKLAETNAWNFQQGCMLQWYRQSFLYNDYSLERGSYTVISDMDHPTVKRLPRPVANVSPDGKYGLSINFYRVYDFRPGYGYCNIPDPYASISQPADDGIFLMDMETGENRLIASYQDIAEVFPNPPSASGKIVINHITFNPASDRFLFLVRNFPENGSGWKTGLGTCDLKGNIYKLRDYTYASHYHWRDPDTLLIHADAGEGPALYELKDQTQDYQILSREFFTKDIHCSYSPDRKYIIGDGYPDKDGYREIFLYSVETGKGVILGKVYSWPVADTDIRCDLHIRWNNRGTGISLDATLEGFRGLYTMDLTPVLNASAF